MLRGTIRHVTRRQFLALIVPLLAVLVGIIAMVALERSGPPGAPPWDGDFARYVRDRMSRDFVWGTADERQAWKAYFEALNAYVRTFDPFAEIVPPWDVARSREASSGQYTGIGIRIAEPVTADPVESIRVTGVKPDGPAAKAGVVVGDEIVAVGGEPLAALTSKGLRDAIRGPEGSVVRLSVRGESGTRRELDVTRGRIDSGSVFGARFVDEPGRIGYARLARFQASTARDLRIEVEKLREAGMRGLVLDLRHNGGGLMDQSVSVADLFLSAGVIMRQRGRIHEFTETHEAGAAGTVDDTIPLAVLIDGGSASASEILAGALQDHKRAVLVGERSFGKFLVQMVEEVPMEIGTALFKRTTSVYETPLGHSYQRLARGNGTDPLAGLVPEIVVPMSKEEHRKLRARFEYEEFADWNRDGEPPADDFEDPQLAAAIDVLRGRTYYPRLPPPKE